jgi:hypothetical protein
MPAFANAGMVHRLGGTLAGLTTAAAAGQQATQATETQSGHAGE